MCPLETPDPNCQDCKDIYEEELAKCAALYLPDDQVGYGECKAAASDRLNACQESCEYQQIPPEKEQPAELKPE